MWLDLYILFFNNRSFSYPLLITPRQFGVECSMLDVRCFPGRIRWRTGPRLASERSDRIMRTDADTQDRPGILLLLTALAAAGCVPASSPNTSPVESRLFSRVEVIGTRGTGPGQFNKPRSVALDAQDNLYVVDMTGRVQKFSLNGALLTSWQ